MRFGTMFFSSQLVDLFAYELPISHSSNVTNNSTDTKNNPIYSSNYILVYNFHNLTFQDRFFFFCIEMTNKFHNFSLNSISELFPNASWLEREVAELHGSIFNNKKDLRNLMLQYGDMSTPFRKSSPSIGIKEFFYDAVNDVLSQIPLSFQS